MIADLLGLQGAATISIDEGLWGKSPFFYGTVTLVKDMQHLFFRFESRTGRGLREHSHRPAHIVYCEQ